LIFYGYLKGYSMDSSTVIKRGQRVYCSKRNRRKGCGKSHSIYLSFILHSLIITTHKLWSFLCAVVQSSSIRAVWLDLGLNLSLTTIYRLYKRFRARHSDIRTILCRDVPPPDTPDPEPARQTIDHIKKCFAKSDDPISDFQHRFQIAFL
jgi:hypothetical protein